MISARQLAYGSLLTTVLACGGAGANVAPIQFAGPVFIDEPSFNGTLVLTGFSRNGKLVGNFTPSGSSASASYYWSSPTATPTLMPGPDCFVSAINNSGVAVGYQIVNPTQHDSVRWSDPASSPITLANPPATSSISHAMSINESGQIVGTIGGSQPDSDVDGVFWDVSLTPLFVQAPSMQRIFNPMIADDGAIFATDNLNFANPNSTRPCWSPDVLSVPLAFLPNSNSTGVFSSLGTLNQLTGKATAIRHDDTGIESSSELTIPPSNLLTSLPGTTASARYVADNGIICGSKKILNSRVAAIWPDRFSEPQDMNDLIPFNPNMTLTDALFITSDGSVIGIGIVYEPTPRNVYFYAQRL